MVKIKSQPTWLKIRPCSDARSDLVQNLQDVHQTPEYAHFMEKLGWKVEIIRSTSEVTRSGSSEVKEIKAINVFIRKLPLLPLSILKILHYHPTLNQKELEKIIQKYHVILIKLQPFALEEEKYNQSAINNPSTSLRAGQQLTIDPSPLIPTKTIWFDLTQSEEELIKQMKPKTRYNLRLTQRNNLKCQVISGDKITGKQLKEFHCLWSQNKPFNFLFKPSFYELKSLTESFGEKCFFVFISNFAACLILTSRNMAAYWHNFSTPEAKKLFAPTLYVWQAIKEAKRRQLKVFDFEGVWDERMPKLNQGWQGFSRFKESFGGEIISFAWPKKSFRFF